jgi:multidrug efflux pump subunit AcrA (membrane-fusion protein)
MKPTYKLMCLTILLCAISLLACSPGTDAVAVELPTATVAPPANSPSPATQLSLVAAEGMVVPARETKLAFETGGRLVALNFAQGEMVEAGDVLARLEDSRQQVDLKNAMANRANAQARLADLLAGTKPEEILRVEADLAKAEAILSKVLAGPLPEEVAEAAAQVDLAQAQLNQLLAGTRPEKLEAAAAQALRAEVDVRQAQAIYDQVVYGDPTDAEEAAVQLQKATLVYEQAKAQHEELVNGPTAQDVAVAQAGVDAARATLNRVAAKAQREDVLQAQADVRRAEAQLAQLKAGPTPEEIAVARAQVDMAQATVDQAHIELTKTKLVAPFTGLLSGVRPNVGEIIQPGVVLFFLGDASHWRIKTRDLTEADVAKLKRGQGVLINIDALPDEKFRGTVIDISPISEAEKGEPQSAGGEVTYTVTIKIEQGNLTPLRWGMTAFVQIEIERL